MYKLIGRYASPSVRRVAIAMTLQELPFELHIASPLLDPSAIVPFNPIGRVPVLVLPDGVRLVESSAILDTLQGFVSPELRLLPDYGDDRTKILQVSAIMSTATEKAIIASYEHIKRPPEKFHEPYHAATLAQVRAALEMVEATLSGGRYCVGDTFSLADISAAVGWRFLRYAAADIACRQTFGKIEALSQRCEEMPAFIACAPETY